MPRPRLLSLLQGKANGRHRRASRRPRAPHAPVGQWALSFPYRIRFLLASSPLLCATVRGIVTRTLLGWLEQRALEASAADLALDVLTCPHCGGPRRLIAQLTDPIVARRILSHLGQPTEPPRPAPARSREQLDFA